MDAFRTDATQSAHSSNQAGAANNSVPLGTGGAPAPAAATLAPAPAAKDDDPMSHPCMIITSEERQWALAIKHAVDNDEDIMVLTDFDYMQYAIVCGDDVDDALQRIRGLQVFRQEYNIGDTFEEGVHFLGALLQQQPGMLLSIDKARTSAKLPDEVEGEIDVDAHSNFWMIFDFARINPPAMNLPADKRNVLAALYYAHHATQPNPNYIRNGILFIAECDSMTWDNISLDFLGPLWGEMKRYYPIRFKEVSWLRAATAATIMFNLCKPFMPPHIRRMVNMGCEFQAFDGRLDELFMAQSTMEEYNHMILSKASGHLQERFHNSQHFRL